MDRKTRQKPKLPLGAATIRDVAREAGVSVATVSRLINGTAIVNPETSERVEAVMRRLEYIPLTSARNLATHKYYTLGLVMDSISGDFFTPLLMGIEAEASEAGYTLFTVSTGRWKRGEDSPPPIGPHNTDGVIMLPGSVEEGWVRRWHRTGFPIVLLYETSPAGLEIPSVTIENTATAMEAALHLVRAHGRRRIVFLTGQEGHHDAIEREAGYRRALAEAGLPFDPALVLPGSYDKDVAARSIEALLDSGARPGMDFDAVFAADDDSAIGALYALKGRGVDVPGAVSVMGFDDQRYAVFVEPPLSTVRAPTEEAGRAAARMLLGLLKGEGRPDNLVLQTEVVYRGSCGCRGS
jgi:DNA-binding LacI/PurR family transcriptional regulator